MSTARSPRNNTAYRAPRLPMVLTAYGMPHLRGRLKTRAGDEHPSPWGTRDLVRVADELGLSGVEMDLPAAEIMHLEETRDLLRQYNQQIVVDFGILSSDNQEQLRETLRAAAYLGASVVRVVVSGILCGDRRSLADGWNAILHKAAEYLRDTLPLAEQLGICVAVENHQDATSDDLLRLWEMLDHNPAFGVTLDTGNPLAVGEDPLEYAGRVAPLVRHLHLKDYTLHFAPSGYHLVRCPAGQGVIDFPAILGVVHKSGAKARLLPGIEGAAAPTRTIPFLEPSWWADYPPTLTSRLLPVLRLLWEKGRPPGELHGSAWERGADSTGVAAEEWEVLKGSVEYFGTLGEGEKQR